MRRCACSAERDAITDFSFISPDQIDLTAFNLVDVSGTDSQITMVNEGDAIPGLGSNIKTIYVDLNDDNSASNNTSRAEVVIYVNAGGAGRPHRPSAYSRLCRRPTLV